MAKAPILFIRDSADHAALWQVAAQQAMPQFDVQTTLEAEQHDRVEVALVWKPRPGLLKSFKNLRLVVSVGAGVDHIVGHDDQYPQHVPLVRMVDPGLTQGMCDYVSWACLSHLRQARHHLLQQQATQWRTVPLETADTKTVTVLGLGEIGLPVAKTLQALGFKVQGWTRRERSDLPFPSFFGADALHTAVSQANVVVNLLPATRQTERLYNSALFAAMRKGVCFINAGRGVSVDEAALVEALESGQVGEAYLDVFAKEPLPEDSPLWRDPRVTLTPHNAAITHPNSGIRAVQRALAELDANQPLSNLVDWQQGY